MNRINKKGFTLIEILAVIIILGVLLVIAIPSISSTILNSRKSTYLSTINGYVDAVRYKVDNFELSLNRKDVAYYIPVDIIELDQGSDESPFGDWESAYVVVIFTGKEHKYYWTSSDDAGYKVLLDKEAERLTEADIISGSDTYISTRLGVAGRRKTCVVSSNGICNAENIMDVES